jgi:putrescine transport system substrate-binding protein
MMIGRFTSFIFLILLSLQSFGHSCNQEEKKLYVYAWAGSISPDILKQFEKETGIKVVYDTYDSNDILEAKLLTGKSKFDLVSPSLTPNYLRQIEMGIFQPIDQAKLRNYKNLDARILKLVGKFEGGNRYGVPHTMGTTGFGYDKKKVAKIFPKGLPQSLSLLFQEENIKKFQSCGVILLDFPQDILESAQAFLGHVPQCQDKEKLEEALEVIRKIAPYIKEFTSNTDRAVRELAAGEACLVNMWSNDALTAQQQASAGHEGIDIGYMIPKEWPGLWVDMLAIPKNAPHPRNAHLFIDFLLRPDIAARVVITSYVAVPNTKIKQHLPKDIRNNPMIFIPEDILENLRVQANLSFRDERMLMRKWTHFKLGW